MNHTHAKILTESEEQRRLCGNRLESRTRPNIRNPIQSSSMAQELARDDTGQNRPPRIGFLDATLEKLREQRDRTRNSASAVGKIDSAQFSLIQLRLVCSPIKTYLESEKALRKKIENSSLY